MSKMRVKLTLATLAVVTLGLVAVALVVESAFSDAHTVLKQALETRGSAYATQLANELSFAVAASAKDEIESTLSVFQDRHDANIGLAVTTADNSILAAIGREIPPDLIASLAKPNALATTRGDFIYSAAPITSEGRNLGHVYCLEEESEAGELRSHSRMICLATYLVVLLLIGAGVYYTGSRLSAPLEKMVSIARSVASGDLTQPALQTSGRDESAKLGAAIDQMADALRIQVGAIKEVANDVLGNSSQVTSASSQLASAASEQASAIAQTTSTIEEIKQAGQLAKQSAGRIVENSEKSVEVSGEGLKAVQASTSEVENIREQVETIAAGIDALRTQVSEVGEIINLVNQVAEQSNLLAVNASIEAAKAGESGRGFAVVAQEVKNLATQSKQATAQVRNTLGSIQNAIEMVFATARAGRERTESGVHSIKNTGAVIRRLGEIIANTSESAKQIAINANEQVVGLEQVAQAMISVNQAATDNLVSTQQVERGSESLTAMARELEQLVAKYQIAG